MGEIRAQAIESAPFNKTLLQESLSKIRAMTLLTPNEFLGPLSQLLASTGVALVVCPHFPGTKAHAATFWLGREKAVLLLTIRGKWADIFWFSLFHEVAISCYMTANPFFLKMAVPLVRTAGEKRCRSLDAADTLIPPKVYERFLKHGISRPFRSWVCRCAPDRCRIVVGRLQHDGRLKHEWNNDLRKRYEWRKTH
jgi:HTH-type transcriptional regulator/antitoxin HigA